MVESFKFIVKTMVLKVSQVAYANGKCIKQTSNNIQQVIPRSMNKNNAKSKLEIVMQEIQKNIKSGVQKGAKKHSKTYQK